MKYILDHLFIIATIWSLITLFLSQIITFITLFSAIPESRVIDDILPLRKLLLIDCITSFLISSIALIIISARYIFALENVRYISYGLLMLFTAFQLASSIFRNRMYTVKYGRYK